jgi:hypothetical protein
MSSFFSEEDNITFGVQGSNEVEVAHFSSTLDDVMFRFFTNNNSETDNFVTGTVLGSSNYDKSEAARNDFYIGHVTDYDKVERIVTIRENRVGINTSDPKATLEIVGSNLGANDLTRITRIDGAGQNALALSINNVGEMGIGTTAVSGNAVTIEGKVFVSDVVVADGIQPPEGVAYLTYNDASFCNITNVLIKGSLIAESNVIASNVLVATNIRPISGNTIQFTAASLSNVTNMKFNHDGVLAIDKVQGSKDVGLIDFMNATLSNLNTLEISNITTTDPSNAINLQQKTLSNLAYLKTDYVQTSVQYGAPGTNVITFEETTLSNVGDIKMASESTLRTNFITSAGNDAIDFNNTSVFNVNDLHIRGDIKVRGEFFVMDTTTCNTNQLVINNDNTGPGLIVIQQGAQHIAQFVDDTDVVMFIKDGGQTAFGNFGPAINTDIPDSLVYIENPSASNQAALYIDQKNANQNRLVLLGPTCNVVVTGDGLLGMGVDAPTARIHAFHTKGDDTEFLRFSSNNDPTFIVTSGAQVGVGTNPSGTNAALFVHGRIQNTADVRTFGVIAPSGTNLYFGMNTLSNIDRVKAQGIHLTQSGSAASPAYTFEADTNTGIFRAADDVLAIATNGAEALRVNASGNVGVGTQTAPISFYINKNDAIRIPVGTNAERPINPQQGYVRYNTSTSTYEGFGSGAWGSLGGVKDVDQDTYISAENAPNEDNDQLKFFTFNAQRMYIGSDAEEGNVGIGTTVARTRLDIDSGTMRAERVQINVLSSTSDIVNVDNKILSNVRIVRTSNLEVTNMSTLASGGLINVQNNSLSNISILSKVGTVDTGILTNTLLSHINVDFKSFSNIASTKTSNLEVTNVSTLAAGGLINVQNNSLSNISILSKVGTVDAGILTNTLLSHINVNFKSLSNIASTKTSNLEVTNVSTLAAGGLINVQNNSLSNISILSKVGTVDAGILTNTLLSHINVDFKSLSNIASTKTSNLEVTNVSTLADGGLINVQNNSLSNISILSKVGTVDVRNITTTDANPNINVNGKSLSNISNVVTTNVRVSNIVGPSDTNLISLQTTSLSNIGDVHIQPGNKLYTNSINSTNGSTAIDFNNQDVDNINNLTVKGDVRIRGEFFVFNTTTCNTNQLVIDNDNTGPGLVVIQRGTEHIAKFVDDSNVVMFIKDGGQTAFGSFGPAINANIPGAVVYVENPATSNQAALYVKQENTDQNVLHLNVGNDSVVVDGSGHVGMGVLNPQARIDVLSRDSQPFLLYSNVDVPSSTLQISKEGRVGIATEAPVNRELFVNGSAQINTVITSSVTAAANSLIDFNYNTLSNIDRFHVREFSATDLSATNITGTGADQTVNFKRSTLSNINITESTTLVVKTITSGMDQNINFATKTLSNIAGVQTGEVLTPSISGTGEDKELRMNYSRVLDVDSLVVRSNVTVTFTGLNTFTNLPTDLVRLDNDTGKILDQYISENIVRLMQDGLINPAMIPVAETGRNTLLHTRDKVGIGLRNPQQKLHVHGNQVITSGRLGIGTTTPLHAFHIRDDNSGLASFSIQNIGSTDIIRVDGPNETPVLYATSSCNVGVRTSAPAYELHVQGTTYSTNAVRTNAIESDSGTIHCRSTSLSNIHTAHMQNLVVTGSMTIPTVVTANSAADVVQTNQLASKDGGSIGVASPFHVTGYSTTLYDSHTDLYGDNTNFTRIGIRVDNSLLARTLLTVSDKRIKDNVTLSDENADFNAVLALPVQRFRYTDRPTDPEVVGFIAQEVEEVAPYAVRTTTGPIPSILRDVSVVGTHTLALSDSTIEKDTILKAIYGDEELMLRVTNVTDTTIQVAEPLPNVPTIFVYGPVVRDFKLLDSERLVPIAFNAIKKMHKTQQDLEARLNHVEAMMGLRT